MQQHSGMRVGLIGIGLVGSALADILLAQGYRVTGYDIDPERCRVLKASGGQAAGSPAAVAAEAERVVLSLMTSDVVRHVVEGEDGLLSADRPPRYIIDTTTGDPGATETLAGRLAQCGLGYLDATISGSSRQIRDRTATFMVGGTGPDFAANHTFLSLFSKSVFHLGPPGSGSRAKLATNLVLGLNRLVLAEGLVFAEALGIDPAAILEVLRNSPAYSVAVDIKGKRMVEQDFAPEARLSQHLKDVELILSYAQAAGQRLPLSSAHRDLLNQAVASGDGELDNSAIIRAVRRYPVPAPPSRPSSSPAGSSSR